MLDETPAGDSKKRFRRRGFSYEDLAERLQKIGINENANNLRAKINRGTFSASFLLQALEAIGCKFLDIGMD